MRHSEAYMAWRESEAYQVPMTEEGEEKAQQRWINFRKGWDAAVKECAKVCDEYAKNSSSPMNFAEDCAKWIRELESK